MQQDVLLPASNERAEIWRELISLVETYIIDVEKLPVAPSLDQSAMRRILQSFSFDEPGPRVNVLRRFTEELAANQVHTPHPCYFGLFNPAPSFMGVMGDAVAAALNPQLAAWSHSPLAVETERHLVHAFAEKFGFKGDADGVLTSGGAEANQTALLCALHHRWPVMAKEGIHAAPRRPVFYASAESHILF
ncbi:MAG: pyridoxal-dependent decarboxylase [Acidobacteriaceae bacterium]